MKHYGDITKINGAEVPIVDVVVGGSPCQDLSVAGKRAGLDGARSGLFMEQIRIVKELRKADELEKLRNGRSNEHIRPRWMVWENVCGAFSSNGGEDFRIVLEETARIADETAVIPRPSGGKWTPAGCVMGDGWSLAWRVHDAQFWGVPQRRKRISLVADFSGGSAPEVLFERKGLSGYSAESGKEGERTPKTTERHFDASSYTLKVRGGCERDRYGKKAGKGALIQTELSGTLGVSQDQTLICLNDQGGSQMSVTENQVATLRAAEHGHQPLLVQGADVYNGTLTGDVACALTANTGTSCTHSGPSVVCLNDQGGSQMAVSENVTGTLRAQEHGHQPILLESNQNHATIQMDGISTALPASMGMGGGYVPMVCGFDAYNQTVTGDKAMSIRAKAADNEHIPCVYGLDRASFNQGENAKYDFAVEEELAPTVLAKGPGGGY